MTSREQRIREIAHRLWEQEGRPPDQERRHWEMAERMVEKEEAGTGGEPARKARPSRPPRAKGAAAPKRRKTSRA
ncbi:MAG TPA: DUF2934 domain-containing protein [Xanthobacteraceae bacterium]|nr:DUF2934 domain-containing protein [Xanthobacteraceae bacterium]